MLDREKDKNRNSRGKMRYVFVVVVPSAFGRLRGINSCIFLANSNKVLRDCDGGQRGGAISNQGKEKYKKSK